jgi:hypothetical protein
MNLQGFFGSLNHYNRGKDLLVMYSLMYGASRNGFASVLGTDFSTFLI